jgi:hypothetical protein
MTMSQKKPFVAGCILCLVLGTIALVERFSTTRHHATPTRVVTPTEFKRTIDLRSRNLSIVIDEPRFPWFSRSEASSTAPLKPASGLDMPAEILRGAMPLNGVLSTVCGAKDAARSESQPESFGGVDIVF